MKAKDLVLWTSNGFFRTIPLFESILRFIMDMSSVEMPRLIREFPQMTSAELHVMMRTLEEEGIVRQEVDGTVERYVYIREGDTE